MTAPAPPQGPEMDTRIAARRAEVVEERRQRRRRRLWSVAVLLAVVVGLVAVARSPLLAISEVAVAGAGNDQAEQAREAAGIAVGDNLFDADVRAAADRVRKLPWVADAEVVRRPLATVEIRLQRREPFAVVRLEGASWTLDAGGVVLAGGAADDLITIDAPEASMPRPGQEATDEAVLAALDFHRQLPDDLAAGVLHYVAERPATLRMQVEAEGGHAIWVRVGEAEEVAQKAEAVQALLPQARALVGPDGPGVVEVDVRVPGNPVLIPEQPEETSAQDGKKGR